MNVEGVLLAAGASRRYGSSRPKQLLSLQGEPLVRRVARAAIESRLSRLVVVVGFRADAVRSALQGLVLEIVENLDYQEGQSTSVKTGLAALSHACSAALFIPADQPFLDAEVINLLIDGYRKNSAAVVIPCFGKRRGAPVLFDRSLFPELNGITGEEGGRQILNSHPERILEVPLPSELPLLDVDTPDDYQRLFHSTTEGTKYTK